MKNILAGDKKKEYASLFGLLYCSIILGTHYIVTKQVSASVDAPTLTAYRFLIAALPLFGYLIYKKKDPFANFKPGAILGFFLWLVFIMISLGLEYTSATNTGFISGIFFVFVPFVDYLIFKKRLQLFNLPIITLSLGGLYLLTGGLTHLSMGDILIFLSAICTAVHLLLVGYYSKQELDPVLACFQQFIMVFLLSILFAFARGGFHPLIPPAQIAPLLFLGLLATFSVFFVQMLSLKRASGTHGAVLLSLQPGFAAFFAYWLGGEKFSGLQLTGGLLLFVSAIIYSIFAKKN